VGPSVVTVQTPGGLIPMTAVEGPRHSHRQGVKGIVYTRDTAGRTNCCGTHRGDSPIMAL
jgi:hypothetical protein